MPKVAIALPLQASSSQLLADRPLVATAILAVFLLAVHFGGGGQAKTPIQRFFSAFEQAGQPRSPTP